jgi:hypothetical protein
VQLEVVHFGEGHLFEAKLLLEKALRGQEKHLKNDATYTTSKMSELAGKFEPQGLLDDAVSLYELVLQSQENILGPHHKAAKFATSGGGGGIGGREGGEGGARKEDSR